MIKFDTGIYQAKAIQQAIRDYRGIAEISMRMREKEIECLFETTQYDLDITIKEFYNYVLCLTVSMNGVQNGIR